MRLIDADWLKAELYHRAFPILNEDDIDNTPTIDAAPAVHGEWIKMSDADGVYFACSECGEDIPRIAHYNPQFDLFPKMESIDRTRFCPYCGAKMDGGKRR